MEDKGDIITRLEEVSLISSKIEALIGFSPLLLLVVVVAVSLIGRFVNTAFFVNKRVSSLVMIFLSFLISFLAILTMQDNSSYVDIAFKTIVFASLSSFAYDVLKPIINGLVNMIYSRVEKITGISVIKTLDKQGDTDERTKDLGDSDRAEDSERDG